MADAVFSFELEADGNGANEQADALERLRDSITNSMAGIKAMGASLRAMKGTVYEGSDAYKALKNQIDAQKASLAGAHNAYAKAGGDFVQLANHQNTLKERAAEARAALKKQERAAERAAADRVKAMKEAAVEQARAIKQDFAERAAAMKESAAKMAAVLGAVGAAALATAVAIGAAAVALFKFGVAAADARRAQLLQLEGLSRVRNWYGLAADKAAFMQGAIDKVSGSSALARDKIAALSNGLQQAGMRGGAYESALQGLADVSSVAGDAQAEMYKAMYLGARGNQAAIRALSADIKARFGDVARRQMLSLDVQSEKLRESFDQLFSGLKIETFLGALKGVTDMFSQNTASGRALKTIVETLFQPMIDFVGGHGLVLKRFFQGLVIGALYLTIGILKVRNALRDAFGDSSILKGIDAQHAALFAGLFVVGSFIAAMGLLAASVAIVAAPFLAVAGAVALFVARVIAAYKFVTAIDWGGLASALVDGLVNGITSRVQRVVDAVKGLGKAATNALKSALDIHSPSRAFARLGMQIPRGLAQGVDSETPAVESAVGDMAGGALAAGPAPRGGGRGFGRSAPVINLAINISGDAKNVDQSMLGRIRDAVREGISQGLESVAIQLGAEVT